MDRERTILKLLSERGSLSVSLLSRDLDVSEVTVRSDLKELEEKGYLIRSRGGAYPALHQSIVERQQQNIEKKSRIARAAALLVRDGDRIMIEAGTTTALIVRYLIGKRDIQVVTNSTLVFSYARLNPALQITLTGGEFRRETESMVGPVALRTIAGLNVRLAFVGTDGFSTEKGLTTQLVDGAEIVKAMRDVRGGDHAPGRFVQVGQDGLRQCPAPRSHGRHHYRRRSRRGRDERSRGGFDTLYEGMKYDGGSAWLMR